MQNIQSSALNVMISRMIDEQRNHLVEEMVEQLMQGDPGAGERYYGAAGEEQFQRNAGFFFGALVEALANSQPALFLDQVRWLCSVMAERGIPLQGLTMNLHSLQTILQKRLPEDAHPVITDYIEHAVEAVNAFEDRTVSLLDLNNPHGELAMAYLRAVLNGDRSEASRLILEAAHGGVPVRDIYLRVLQPVQHEVGRLWQANQISVAHEHFVTAVTQLVMSQLYPFIFSTSKHGRRMVATCVGGELHEIGIRMVADFFEMDGWDSFYLGANTPANSVVQSVIEREAEVLALSATMTAHVGHVSQLIEVVRTSAASNVRILVGGYPFNLLPDLWQRIGADGYAPDAEAALRLVGQLD